MLDKQSSETPAASPRDAQGWVQALARYRQPSVPRGVVEIAITVGPFVLLWVLMWLALGFSYWLTLALAIPASGFLLHLFIILHDCGHNSLFGHRAPNDWVGRVCGVLTLTRSACGGVRTILITRLRRYRDHDGQRVSSRNSIVIRVNLTEIISCRL
jgi:acyl-lipid omega-6 desaturase (Delta-12 desaturase)